MFFHDENITSGKRDYSRITLIYGRWGEGKTWLLSKYAGLLYVPIGPEQGEGGWADDAVAERCKRRPMNMGEVWLAFPELKQKYAKNGDRRIKAIAFDGVRGVYEMALAETGSSSEAQMAVRRFVREVQEVRNVTDAEVYITCGDTFHPGEKRILPGLFGHSETVEAICYTVDNVWFLTRFDDRPVIVTRELRLRDGRIVSAKTRGRLPHVVSAGWGIVEMTFEQYVKETEMLVEPLLSRRDELTEEILKARAEHSFDRLDAVIAVALKVSP